MGVRLYPNTRTVASLERLIGVPAGTANRLAEIKARHDTELENAPREQHHDLRYTQWQEINNDKHLGEYDVFLTFGWGKFADPHGVAPDCAGSLIDPVKIALLFRPNNIGDFDNLAEFIALCEGVHWC